jgi:hypothetical protein
MRRSKSCFVRVVVVCCVCLSLLGGGQEKQHVWAMRKVAVVGAPQSETVDGLGRSQLRRVRVERTRLGSVTVYLRNHPQPGGAASIFFSFSGGQKRLLFTLFLLSRRCWRFTAWTAAERFSLLCRWGRLGIKWPVRNHGRRRSC